uniref:Haloacid dehalogenase-like hydrolase domain-containing protein 2 n=1 Tax=Mastacembelus armatus TaxID=205130 RepID=A0A7N9ATT6_9TELE
MSTSAGVQHGRQTGSEGCAHRPEWNATYRRHGSTRGTGCPEQVGNSPQTRKRQKVEGQEFECHRLILKDYSAPHCHVVAASPLLFNIKILFLCFGAVRLRQASVAVKFVTNTTKESKRILLERLQRLNFDLQEKEIFTSLSAARSLLEQKEHRPLLLVDDSALEDFTGIDTSEPNAVVVGLAPDHFNYKALNKAFRMILDGAPLIAIHKARYYKRKDGLALGPGPFVTGLEYATDCKAIVVGKPEKTFFTQDARDDVGGAQNAGMLGILVKTGKYREGDENKISPPPHLTCDSFPDAVEHILKNLL